MAISRKYIAGAYSVLWNALNLGYTENGFDLVTEFADIVPITEDRYGAAEIEGVFAGGLSRCFVSIESLHWTLDTVTTALPFLATPTGVGVFIAGEAIVQATPGDLVVRSALAKPLILTPKTGIAITNDAFAWTFPYAYSIETINLRFAGRELRRVPITMQAWPAGEGGALAHDTDDTKKLMWWSKAAI